MDTGSFTRTQPRLLGWLVAPLVAICLVYALGNLSSRRTAGMLQDRVASLSAFDDINRSLQQARQLANVFHAARANDQDWNSQLYTLANDSAVSVLSVVRRASRPASAGVDGEPEVVVRAEASILGLSKFLNELERPARMLSIKTMQIDCVGARDEPRYQAEFVFRSRPLPAGTPTPEKVKP